jgi:hypothetical protein
VKVPPDSLWSKLFRFVCLAAACSSATALSAAQEQSVQKRQPAPVTEVQSARLPEEFRSKQTTALPDPPGMRYKELQERAPARVVLPRLDPKPYLDEDALEMKKFEHKIRGGVMRPVKISPEKDGEWIEVEPGVRVWRVEIQSPGAEGIRLHLTNVALASGSQLFIHSSGAGSGVDRFAAANVPNSHEIYSSPSQSARLRWN